MSVILDALKRLDREKSSRRGGTANIAAEILRPELSRPRKKIALYAIPVFLTAIAAAAVTYVLMSEPGPLPKSSPPVPVSHPAPIQQATPAPLSREPVRDARDEISRVPQKMESPAGSKPTETPSGEKKVERNVTFGRDRHHPWKCKESLGTHSNRTFGSSTFACDIGNRLV